MYKVIFCDWNSVACILGSMHHHVSYHHAGSTFEYLFERKINRFVNIFSIKSADCSYTLKGCIGNVAIATHIFLQCHCMYVS